MLVHAGQELFSKHCLLLQLVLITESCLCAACVCVPQGNRTRRVSSTAHNSVSSRSHAILQVSASIEIRLYLKAAAKVEFATLVHLESANSSVYVAIACAVYSDKVKHWLYPAKV
jgi:hypothetical protein